MQRHIKKHIKGLSASALRVKRRAKVWLLEDGTVNTSYFLRSVDQSLPLLRKGRALLRGVWYNVFVSPVFLGMMVSIILLLPSKLLQTKGVARRVGPYLRKQLKRAVDIAGALVGLILSLGAFLVLPILIKLDSQGRAFFRQIRVGRNRRKRDRRVVSVAVPYDRRKASRRLDDLLGEPFEVYKFRSMKEDAERGTGPVWASADDPRITTVGKFLRPYHIDEVPQFLNVLRGHMSLVGPRPERPEFVTKLKRQIPLYELRFRRKPGLTGLAQINCGYDTSVADVNEKLKFDIEYTSKLAIRRDLKIMWDTVRKMTAGEKVATNGKGSVELSRRRVTTMLPTRE